MDRTARLFVAALVAALVLPGAAYSQAGSSPSGPTFSADGGPSAGRVIWLRADRGVTCGLSNLVSKWADASGNRLAVHGSGNSESEPELVEAAIGGRPALRFDGNDWLGGGGMPTSSYTKAAVCQLDDLAAANNVVSSVYHHALWFAATPYARLSHSGDLVQSSVAAVAGRPVILVASYDARSRRTTLWLDGQLVGRADSKVGNWDATLLLGSFGYGNFMKGLIAEVSVYDHELDPAELMQLHGDLQRRYFDPATPTIDWVTLPRPGQLFQQDTNAQADVLVNGAVTTPGAVAITLEVTRDGASWWHKTNSLQYSAAGRAQFSFTTPLDAGLHDYELAAWVDDAARRHLVARVHDVVVGDVYVLNGQSNAQAADYYGEHLVNVLQSKWIRSFGTATTLPATDLDLHWDLADGAIAATHASVGQWGLKLAHEILQHEHVPVAILNGAVGGTTIAEHQCNDSWRTDPSTIYGRLLLRMRKAGVAESCRALLWYQGEADAWNPGAWYTDWVNLRADWAVEYPALERIYVVQIRNDCGGGGDQLKEIQRTLADLWSDTTVMSSTALPAHDGCHYMNSGYFDLGEKLARLVRRDFNGSTDTQEIEAPNLLSAAWADGTIHKKIALTFRDANAVMVFEPGSGANFSLSDGMAVSSAEVSGNVVTLRLARRSRAATISYHGHPFDGPSLRNRRGVGALCFEGFTIQ